MLKIESLPTFSRISIVVFSTLGIFPQNGSHCTNYADNTGGKLINYDYTAGQQSPLMNTISSLKENAIACAPFRDKQVEVVSNFLEGHDAFRVLPITS